MILGKSVFVFNYGLHYRLHDGSDLSVAGYRDIISRLMDFAVGLSRDGHHVFYRETSAQHFHTSTGEYVYSESSSYNQPSATAVSDITLNAKLVARYNLTEVERATGFVLGSHSVLSLNQSYYQPTNQSTYQSTNQSDPKGDPNLFFTCAVLSESQLLGQDWKNEVVKDVLRGIEQRSLNNQNERIHNIPFYNLTAGRYDFHQVHRHQDCTHYCLSPLLFISVWDHIVGVLENKQGE